MSVSSPEEAARVLPSRRTVGSPDRGGGPDGGGRQAALSVLRYRRAHGVGDGHRDARDGQAGAPWPSLGGDYGKTPRGDGRGEDLREGGQRRGRRVRDARRR